MSYILEALRKADAERERGAVPNLHAQMRPLGAAAAPESSQPSRAAWWWVAGALLAAAAAAAWYLFGRDTGVRIAVAPPPVAAAPVAQLPPSASAPTASTPASAAAAASAAAKPEPPAPPPRKPKRVVRTKPKPAVTAPAVQSQKAPPADAPALRVPPLAELPGELRQQVPAMVIGGSVYSPQASARMVIVNGQVFQEGSSLAPELKLEQIRPKKAVFSIRGTLFEMPL